MGIPVQKWQWPVNQTCPLGATCAACVKLHKGKTVLTFHHERVWERILSGWVISFAFYMPTWDSSRGSIASTYNMAKSWTKHLTSSFPPVLQFTFLWVMRNTERRILVHLSLVFCLKWNLACGLNSLLWRGRDWFCQSGDCLTSSLNHKTIDWEWWIHS